jgi:hypothetical protein
VRKRRDLAIAAIRDEIGFVKSVSPNLDGSWRAARLDPIDALRRD